MAEGGVEDINAVVDCLENMFQGVINRDAIISIVDSCGGDLNLSIDAIMKITSDIINRDPVADTENNKMNIKTNVGSVDTQQNKTNIGGMDMHQNKTNDSGVETHQIKTNVCGLGTHQSKKKISGAGTHQNKKNVGVVDTQQNLPLYASAASKPSNFGVGSQQQGVVKNITKIQQSVPKNNQSAPPPPLQNVGGVPNVRRPSFGPANAAWNDQLRRIVETHNRGSRIMILMRGPPGCGKTHLSETIIEMLIGGINTQFKTHICSTDDFFLSGGEYNFQKSYISEAHAWNQRRVIKAMNQGVSPIVIDNTNIEIWEMEFYVRSAVRFGYILEVVEPATSWALKPNVLAKKNVHNVPLCTIKRMLDNYFRGIDGTWLMRHFRLNYPPDKQPPVLRNVPAFFPDVNDVNAGASTSQQPIQITDSAGRDINLSADDQMPHIEQEMANTSLSTNPPYQDDLELLEEGLHNVENEVQKNESENNNYLALQQQLEEIEKVEQEWENGESWEEFQPESASSNNVEENNPKPPRASSPKLHINVTDNFANVVNNCQDWRQISLFMPSWKDETPHSEDTVEPAVETRSSSTCMESGDFDWNKTSHKIIAATPRNINKFHISCDKEKIPEKRMLDKSTTTNELLLTDASRRCINEESHFSAFRKLFKNISKTALRDIFDQCMGDVNWAVEIVLDGMASNQFVTVKEEEENVDDDDNHELCSCLSSYHIVPDTSPEPVVSEQESTVISELKSVPKKTSKRDIKTSDASLQLKRQIEQNVFIAENHYSKHCLKLRKWRHGEYLTDEEAASQDENQPSTSQGIQFSHSSNQAVACDSESDEQNSDDEDSTASMEELEKTVNINLGREFIAELDALFGRTDMSYPDSLMPKINIPLSLLNEINALWMESLMHQLDEHERQAAKMMREDEEFARVLAMKEAELALVGKQPEVLDFKEIMDMDFALSLYQRDVAEWKNKEPNDLAAKLTREKLYNLFPDVPNEVLAELLMAHDNNFQSTVEVLLVSTGKSSVLEEQNGLNNYVMQKEMERQKKILEEEKRALSEVEWPLLPTGEVPDMNQVNSYRDDADRHLRSRDLNIQKASEYVRRGMLTVGGYYRELAEFHKLKYEQSNSLAAASLMQLHAANCPDSATIDLHYLRVGEAKESLDLFLDTHIQKLKSLQSQGIRHHTLYFITGRGLHSNGKPRIKPAVKKRLRERGLNCSEVNPGLLSAKVCADDVLTHQVA